MDSGDVVLQSNRIGDKELILSKFSCMRYKEYKKLRNELSNFEQFIKSHDENSNKKTGFNPLNLFKEDNHAKIIIKNIKKKNYIVIESNKYDKFAVKEKAFQSYLERIKKLNIENAQEEDLKELVKLYLYIYVNQKLSIEYQLSFIEPLLENYKKVINNTLDFFLKKQQMHTLVFVKESYYEIISLLFVIKKVMNNENIEQFKKIDKHYIFNEIKNQASHVKDMINIYFSQTETLINDKIQNIDKKCNEENQQKNFINLINQNKDILDKLINNINNAKKSFDDYLSDKNKTILQQLQLEELQKQKEEFEKNMSKFENVNMENISKEESYYKQTDKKSFLFIKWENYNLESTLNKYKEEVQKLFNSKSNILDIIDKNRDKAINDIEGIFMKFNETIDGFKNNFKGFENLVKEVELFIYKVFGITD